MGDSYVFSVVVDCHPPVLLVVMSFGTVFMQWICLRYVVEDTTARQGSWRGESEICCQTIVVSMSNSK